MSNNNNYSVYIHTNKANGKQYVGITCQRPETRWGKDGTGYAKQRKFWNAIQKYGWNGFTHEVLTTGLTKAEAAALEIELIADGDSINNGYNVSPGGDLGTPQKVMCIETGEKFDSETEAGAAYNVESHAICTAAYNDTTCAGYHWKFVEDLVNGNSDKKYIEGTHVVCVETGKEFVSYREAADYYGIKSYLEVRRVVNDFDKTAGGKHWMSPLSVGIDDQKEDSEEEHDEKFFEEAEEAALEDYFNDYLQYTCDEEWS